MFVILLVIVVVTGADVSVVGAIVVVVGFWHRVQRAGQMLATKAARQSLHVADAHTSVVVVGACVVVTGH